MTTKVMRFGTRGYEVDIPAPARGADIGRKGYSARMDTLDGAAVLRTSEYSHREFNYVFDSTFRDDLRVLDDFRSGMYGDGLLYFIDPMSQDKNAISSMWGQPYLGARGALPLFPGQKPTLIQTPQNPYRYPVWTARYKADRPSEKLYMPLIPRHTAWVGFHGAQSGNAGVRVTPTFGPSVSGTPIKLSALTVTDPILFSHAFTYDEDDKTGIEFDLIQTGLGRNYVPNPSFEGSADGASVLVPTATDYNFTNPQTGGKFGDGRARVTFNQAPSGTGAGIRVATPLQAGKVYTFSGYVRSNNSTRVGIQVTFLSGSDTVLSTTSILGQTGFSASTWTSAPRIVAPNIIAPAGTESAFIDFITVSGTGYTPYAGGDWFELDAVMVNDGAVAIPYSDGSMAGWHWADEPNESVSIETADIIDMTALIVQYLPTGQSPLPGNFISAQGHGGCRIEGNVGETAYSAARDKMGATVKLVEVIE